jgi:type VI secretion system protein ImpI
MALTLTIENETSLPDGGPLSVTTSGGRGLDIGRDQHLDWALPDPSRAVSGRHCEIRFRDGGWWLRDISTNGTFVNGGEHRVQSPYRLQSGDRLEIGHYIIAVVIDDAAGQAPSSAAAPPSYAQPESLWAPSEEAAPPIPRRDLMPPNYARPVHAGFIDWAADIPTPSAEPPPPPAPDWSPPPARADEFAWAPLQPQPLPPEEPVVAIPTPRRPPASGPAGASPWDEPIEDPVPLDAAAPAEQISGPDSKPTPVHPFPAEASPQPRGPAPISTGEFMQRFAKGAGVSPQALTTQDTGAFAEQLGGLMRLIAEELKGLLAARAETKRIARSTSQTMIQAQDNNPLKFSPTVDDALQLIFGQPRSGYLDAKRAFDESFRDLKAHQIKTYSAMQHALKMLVEDLNPQAISEATAQDGGGLGGLIGSRKAKMWEAYVARWDAKTAPYENGLVDAFMIYFAECYDRGGK